MLDLIHRQLKPSTASLLFLVLPLPCVKNSRYLDTNSLLSLMKESGYRLVRERWKPGAKVGYWLWSREAKPDEVDERWRRKVQIHQGSKMNNFAITLP
jgi:25S rRNA (adenine2142-N1)-methyltransferase